MSSKKIEPSPYSTGGGGYDFEQNIATYYLSSLLSNTDAKGLSGKIKQVEVQRRFKGHFLDDIIIKTENEQLDLQIKHNICISASRNNKDFRDIINTCWKTFLKLSVSSKNIHYGFGTSSFTKEELNHFCKLPEWASSEIDSESFFEKVEKNEKKSKYLQIIQILLKELQPNINRIEIWKFISHLKLIRFNVESPDDSDLIQAYHNLTPFLNTKTNNDEKLLFGILKIIIQEYERNSGSFSRQKLNSILVNNPNFHFNDNLIPNCIIDYLQKQYDYDKFIHLNYLGEKMKIELDDIFVDLNLDVKLSTYYSNSPMNMSEFGFNFYMEDTSFLEQIPQSIDLNILNSFYRNDISEFFTNKIKLNKYNNNEFLFLKDLLCLKKIILEGIPGQGKSTLVQKLTQDLRKEILIQKTNFVPDPVIWPFKIKIQDLVEFLKTNEKKSIEQYLCQQINIENGGSEFNFDEFYKFCSYNKILLILDGFDEIGLETQRELIIEKIKYTINRFEKKNVDFCIILTSRPPAIRDHYKNLEEYSKLIIQPLNELNMSEIIDKWIYLRNVEKKVAIRMKLLPNQKESLFYNLICNPLQLSMLLYFIEIKEEAFPNKRTELFNQFVNLFIERETNKISDFKNKKELFLRIHRFIGYKLHSISESGKSGNLSRNELISHIAEYLSSIGYQDNPELLFKEGEVRLGFITINEGFSPNERYGFQIKLIEEYFTAEYLFRYTDHDKILLFQYLIKNSFWKEIGYFFAGLMITDEMKRNLLGELKELDRKDEWSQIGRWEILKLICEGVFLDPKSLFHDAIDYIFEIFNPSFYYYKKPNWINELMICISKEDNPYFQKKIMKLKDSIIKSYDFHKIQDFVQLIIFIYPKNEIIKILQLFNNPSEKINLYIKFYLPLYYNLYINDLKYDFQNKYIFEYYWAHFISENWYPIRIPKDDYEKYVEFFFINYFNFSKYFGMKYQVDLDDLKDINIIDFFRICNEKNISKIEKINIDLDGLSAPIRETIFYYLKNLCRNDDDESYQDLKYSEMHLQSKDLRCLIARSFIDFYNLEHSFNFYLPKFNSIIIDGVEKLIYDIIFNSIKNHDTIPISLKKNITPYHIFEMIERYPQNLEDIFYGIDKIDIITYSSIIETHYIDYKKLNLNNEKILQILQIMKKINVWDKGFFRKICVPQIYFEIFNPEKDSIHINPLEELAPLLNFCEFPLKTYIQNIEKNIDSYNPSTLYSYARIFMDLKKEDKFLLSEFIESTIKPIKKIKDIPIWIIIKSYNENPGYLKNQLCLSDIDIETALHIYSLNKKDIDEYIKIQILNLKKPKCI